MCVCVCVYACVHVCVCVPVWREILIYVCVLDFTPPQPRVFEQDPIRKWAVLTQQGLSWVSMQGQGQSVSLCPGRRAAQQVI